MLQRDTVIVATLIKEGYSFIDLVHIVISGSVVARRQIWCWRRNWEFYIWISRKQEVNHTPGIA